MEEYEDEQEWETRPIYDVIKIDLFKKWGYAQLALHRFRNARTDRNFKNFQNMLMLLFDALRPHLTKRYKKLPEIIEWLDRADQETSEYKDTGQWLTAYKTLSQELMTMGILNIHDIKDDPYRELE